MTGPSAIYRRLRSGYMPARDAAGAAAGAPQSAGGGARGRRSRRAGRCGDMMPHGHLHPRENKPTNPGEERLDNSGAQSTTATAGMTIRGRAESGP